MTLDHGSWVVGDVRGRRTGSEKGLATVHSMTLRRPDASDFVVERVDRGSRAIGLDVVLIGKPIRFDRCPICLVADPNTDEHVPPDAVGGSVMTSTCERCNTHFGSVVEPDLVDWWEDALQDVRLAHDDVIGPRRAPRILNRQKDSGEPVLVFDRGGFDPAIRKQMRLGGAFTMTFSPPSPQRYRLAALKSAYLASCVLLGTIPTSPEADAVRAELMSVRDLPRRQPFEGGPIAGGLRLERSNGPAAPGEIAMVRVRSMEGSEPEFAISLVGTLLVSWPIGGYLVAVGPEGPMPAIRLRGWGRGLP
jgi:HNH endonuclease